jgi:hypothetical protein
MSEAEPHQLFPLFWRNAACLVRTHLAQHGIEADDAEEIASDIMRRCSHIEPRLPVDPESPVHYSMGILIVEMTTAARRLFSAGRRHVVGVAFDELPVQPAKYDHPFLIALQKVISEIEADANKAGRRLN